MRLVSKITSAILLVLLCTPGAMAAELYRYLNDEGNTVIDYHVPPRYIGNGYEVLNEDGILLRIVPRERRPEEEVAWSDQQKREQAQAAEQERLRKWDESLMLRYSSVADIEDARDRSLRDLRIRLSILKGNRRSLKSQVESYQSQAADLERMGNSAGVELVAAIEELQRQIEAGDRSIEDREKEIEEVAASYQHDIERFEQLQHMVELRRQRP